MTEIHHIPDERPGEAEHRTRDCWCSPQIEDLEVHAYLTERVFFHRETGIKANDQ